jgi:predicted MPP superfamily phosphohydrolase
MPDLSRRRFLGAATLGTAGVIGALYGASSNELEVTTHEHLMAPDAPRLRVAVLTDMHSPHDYVEGKRLIAAVRRFQPHLIAIAGDAVDQRGHEYHVEYYGAMEAPLGKFATLGNWEYQGLCDLSALRRHYEHAGVRLLVNDSLRLNIDGAPIDLVGLDDWRAGLPDYGLLERLPAGPARTIVMSHCPVTFEAIKQIATRPSLTVAGHTHGGQIAPFGLAILVPEGSGPYVKGWYHGPNSHAMYVSRGLGNSGIPMRVGSRPELVLITI